MKSSHPASSYLVSSLIALTLSVPLSTPSVHAQSTASAAADLARYDKNHNGVLDSDELAAKQADEAAVKATGAAEASKDVIQMSPFEVRTDKDEGYTATNAMSGTRLNSRLEDLAAPLTVVTKQQLIDTAAVDINDIFLYEANTEGMQQYTEFTIDRNFYNENTTLNPQSSNRIRGIGSANTSVNNFSSTGTIPVDTYNLESVEISRGPNSNIFGLGNAAGTVNLHLLAAKTDRQSAEAVGRVDSYGGWRTVLNVNTPVIRNRLAILGAYVHEQKGFIRKPAYENINRGYVTVTARPTKKTTIYAGYENYNNRFSRANTTLPRDSFTEWKNGGMPVWDPTASPTGGWRYLNGTTYTPVTTGGESAGLPITLLPGASDSGIWTNPAVSIERDGQVTFYGMGAAGSSATAPSPPSTPVYRYVQTGSQYRRGATASGTPLILYQAPSLVDKSIYDWTKTNYLAPNYGRDKGDTYRFEVEQNIWNGDMNRVDVRGGVFREVVDRYDHSIFSRSDSAIPFVSVDVNEKLIDGTPNPNFLRPYMGGGAPAIKYTDETNTHQRGEIAYQLNFTREKNWLQWLGRHAFDLYGERRDILTTSLTSRDLNVSNYSWSSANDLGSIPLRGNTYRIYPRYYIGGPITDPGPVFDYAPASKFYLGSTPLTWYTSGRVRNAEAAKIQEVIQSGNSKDREIRSLGAIWQGFFLKDRIVPTIGWRSDRNREHSSRSLNSNLNATTTIDPDTHLHDLSWLEVFPNPWEEKHGQSRQQGVVVKATKWLNLEYNQSDGFKPETLAYNINGELLPNPTGKSKDYGFTLKLLDDKLVARVTRYRTQEKNSRNGSITSAAVTRTLRLFFDTSSSNAIAGTGTITPGSTLPNGQDAFDLEQASTQWYLWANPTWSIDQAHAAAITNYLQPLGIDAAFISRVYTIGASNFTDVNTVTSSGTEVELSYNPTRYWRMKLTGGQQKAVDSELGNAVTDYINTRLDALQKIVVPTNQYTVANGTAGLKWWQISPTNPNATGTTTPAGFYVANVKSVIGLATANAGKPRAQTREYRANFTTNYDLAGLTENRWFKPVSIGGSVRWESRAALGYYGAAPSTDPAYKGAVVEYDPNRPIYDTPRVDGDVWASYRLRFWRDRVRCKLQLNVKNVFENGRLQAISYNPDGTAWNYRIIDPRQYIFTVTFDL